MRAKGKIVSWNEAKGYGFILPLAGGKQVFLHITALSNRGRSPEIGQVVTYEISSDKQGRPCAANATLVGDRIQEDKKKSTGTISILLGMIFIGINQWGQTRSICYNSPNYQKEGSDYGTSTPFCYKYREKLNINRV